MCKTDDSGRFSGTVPQNVHGLGSDLSLRLSLLLPSQFSIFSCKVLLNQLLYYSDSSLQTRARVIFVMSPEFSNPRSVIVFSVGATAEYSRVIFQKTVLSDAINSADWIEWSSNEPNAEDVLFGEYDNSGNGAEGTRASFATKLSSAISITSILGSEYKDWVDISYIS